MSLIVSDRFSLIIGLGKTGFACAQYLALQGERFQVADSRQHPPFFDQLTLEQPETPIHLGDFPHDLCANAHQIILSPGVSMQEPALVAAARAGVPIRSDVDIFAEAARLANVPIVAITGSNAKSTVTSLVGQMAKTAGLNVAVGGNLGEPSVSLLADNVDLYVMELSSFQLESTSGLGASVACVLNVSPDHMDRYDNLMSYHQAKHRVFQGCKAVVINGDDALTNPLVPDTVTQTSFSLGDPDVGQFGLREEAGTTWMVQGLKPIMAVRCEWVADIDGVAYINDSKGTNIGATVAALEGLGPALTGKIMLIAGGLGKGADFSELVAPLSRYGKQVVLIGRDANDIEMALVDKVRCIHAQDMQSAVSIAHAQAVSGDLVLLSPACASFDAYANFQARGDHFSALVRALA
jgi:UDP-N-acetylmuramoylalanine--D-glutamate ligase